MEYYFNLLLELKAQFVLLGAFTIFVPALINFLKTIQVVPDGTAAMVNAVIEAVLFAVFVGIKLFAPSFDIPAADAWLVQAAAVLTFLITFLGQLGISKLSYVWLWSKFAGVLGFSYNK